MEKTKTVVKRVITENGTNHISIFPLVDEKESLNVYQIESIYAGGSYDGSSIKTLTLSSAIEILLTNRLNNSVAKGLITPVIDGIRPEFELLNGVRI